MRNRGHISGPDVPVLPVVPDGPAASASLIQLVLSAEDTRPVADLCRWCREPSVVEIDVVSRLEGTGKPNAVGTLQVCCLCMRVPEPDRR